jgi:hypothetical protein
MSISDGFGAAWAAVAGVEGWLTEAQARRLWDAAARLRPGAQVVEIGSYRGRSAIVLAKAVGEGVRVHAIDPHAGNDRGPLEIHGRPEEGEGDHAVFVRNLDAAGVTSLVRHVRLPSASAHGAVEGDVDLLYVDGAHRYAPALDDLRTWGDRVAPGGTMLIHDSFNAIGVTAAQVRALVLGGRFRYAGRSGSLSEYHREDLGPRERARNAVRQVAQLGYFAQSVAIKVALVARQVWLARLLGHRSGTDWPY